MTGRRSPWRWVADHHDRRVAAGILTAAALAAWISRDFRVSFLVDPVGPRGLPLVAAGLLLAGASWMVLRPGARTGPEGRDAAGGSDAIAPLESDARRDAGEDAGQDAGQDVHHSAPPKAGRGPLGAALATLFLYPALLPVLGFPLATGFALWALARPLGARGWWGAVVSFGLAGGLYLVFVYLLGVRLPVGRLFLAGGS